MPSEYTYPIAELFISPQGEGTHAGTLMQFIRLAGCNVGKFLGGSNPRATPAEPKGISDDLDTLRVLHPRHSICTTALGQSFLCDTDYTSAVRRSVESLLHFDVPVNAICITGGEPFLHDLRPLVFAAASLPDIRMIQIETSGTKPISASVAEVDEVWITCSPKAGYLPANREHIDEFKFVLDGTQPFESVLPVIYEICGLEADVPALDVPVFIQPVNGVTTVDHESLAYVLALQRHCPLLKLSVQMHKLIGVQ
jgi:organic radical activating enzyme